MNTIKVSVIVPMYNAEKFVRRMLDSLLAQTMVDFEVIMVNDGSNDGSSVICDDYAVKDTRFKVIHQQNAGVAMARKAGIDVAQGEYSIHADADDWVEPTMLNELYHKAINAVADMVICDYYDTSVNGVDCYHRQRLTSDKPLDVLYDITQGRCFGGLWHKLIRTNLYKKYNARFFAGINYSEDVLILAQILKHEEVKVAYLDKAYYHYIKNEDSITHYVSQKTYNGLKMYLQKIKEILPSDNGRFDAFKRTLPIAVFQMGFMNYLISDEEARKEYLRIRTIVWENSKSLRWKLGYLMIDLNMMTLAHKLIKF